MNGNRFDRIGFGSPESDSRDRENKGKMTEREIRKLRRVELLDLLIEQGKLLDTQQAEIDRLRAENTELKEKVNARKLEMEKAGSIAVAAIKITRVFEAAEEAALIYLDNLRDRSTEATPAQDALDQALEKRGVDLSQEGRVGAERRESIDAETPGGEAKDSELPNGESDGTGLSEEA